MVANDQSFELELNPQALHEIERFTDLICDQLFINETYYGNILMSLTEFITYLQHHQQKERIKLIYNTDYQKVKIEIQPIEPELLKDFDQEISLDTLIGEEARQSLYLIRKLVDELEVTGADSISLVFDISALHNEVYEYRKNQLHSYFTNKEKKKVKEKDDLL